MSSFQYLSQVVPLNVPFVELLYALEHQSHFCFLDSSLVHHQHGRYSVLYSDPFTVIHGNTCHDWQSLKEMYFCCQQMLPSMDAEGPFVGGIAGMISYDFGSQFESVMRGDAVESHEGFIFGFYDTALVYDHQQQQLILYSTGLPQTDVIKREAWAEQRLEEMMQWVNHAKVSIKPDGSGLPKMTFKESMPRREYEDAVKKALDYIKAGDIYQVNVSHEFNASCNAEPKFAEIIGLYERLRESSPAGFASCCRADDLYVLSSSPERFIKMRDRQVETRPMKGTRPRGHSHDEDRVLRTELWDSVKDKAELLMITDLLRNDLGRVCEYGSIHVSELRTMEEYQTVFQTTSTVQGQLKKNMSPFDVIEACFPGGSITGCPKLRSMDIIKELEKTPRHFYTGSLGYIDFNGNMDLNILIRTIMYKNHQFNFHVGGGVVADSNPAHEYEETLVKARAMMAALHKNG